VLGAVVVLADGTAVTLGGEAPDAPGMDLLAVVSGSEGTCAIVTEICVRLLPTPEGVKTLLFDFDTVEDACRTVSRVIAGGIVPRPRLAEALSNVYRFAAEKGLEAGNVFHAGDGNLHPHVLFDADDPGQQAAALEVSHKILRMCIDYGGTISGEHGVGIEKRPMMRELFAPQDLAAMARARQAFDPEERLN